MTEIEAKTDSHLYRLASAAVDEWLEIHKGETFDLDLVYRQLQITDPQKRKLIAIKLAYEVKKGHLEKKLKTYRYIDNTLVRMNNWVNATKAVNLELQWPFGVNDDSEFGFDGKVCIPEKGLIVIAGVTNTGKSSFCRNFLWCNMDRYHCTYFSSETSEEDFADYASRMTWKQPTNGNGPIFDLVWRNNDWKDVIQPNDINIIDWLNMGDNFYKIGEILEGIKDKLNHGICLVALQKDPTKELGVGGMWSEHLSSLYLTLDFNRLTVKKAKKWHTVNPNGKTWGFEIIDFGTHFHNIRPLKKCGSCFQGKTKGQTCTNCNGTGWADE